MLVSRMSVVIHDHAPMWKNPATVFVLLQSNSRGICVYSSEKIHLFLR